MYTAQVGQTAASTTTVAWNTTAIVLAFVVARPHVCAYLCACARVHLELCTYNFQVYSAYVYIHVHNEAAVCLWLQYTSGGFGRLLGDYLFVPLGYGLYGAQRGP